MYQAISYDVKTTIYRKYSSWTFGLSLDTSIKLPLSCPQTHGVASLLQALAVSLSFWSMTASFDRYNGEMSDWRCVDHPNFFNDWWLYTKHISFIKKVWLPYLVRKKGSLPSPFKIDPQRGAAITITCFWYCLHVSLRPTLVMKPLKKKQSTAKYLMLSTLFAVHDTRTAAT